MRGATEGTGDGRQATGLHRLRDRDPAEGGVCPIGGARGPLIAHANPMGGSVGAVPRGSPDASVSIAAACDHCITSHLVQYPSLTSNCGSTCLQMRTRTHLATTRDHSQTIKRRHHAWRGTCYGALNPLRGATPEQNGCNAHGSGAMPTDRVQCPRIGCNARGSGVPRSQIRTSVEPGIPQRERRRPKRPYTKPGTWQPVGFEYVWMG